MTTQTVNFSNSNTWMSGTLPAGKVSTANASGAPMPMTLTLVSTDAGREIAISTDGGVNFFVPAYDASPAAFLSVAVKAPISHARFTGALNDPWSIR